MRILLTGGAGMLGRSLVEEFAARRPEVELHVLTRRDVDLRDTAATRDAVRAVAPDAVVHAAAKVGGIAAKLAEPLTYLRDNVVLDANVIGAAVDARVPELLYVGSAAVYPQRYERPYVEDDMLAGAPEGANEGYAIAKIAGAKLCEYASRQHGLRYRVAVPSNLYGRYDHFLSPDAHLIAAALGKVHRAHVAGDPTVTVWGDGTARREFTWAGDLAGWLVGQVGRLDAWPARLNLGCGADHSVTDFYRVAARVVGYRGDLVHDTSRPSGVPRRLIDSTAARALGWSPSTSLEDGMAIAYAELRRALADGPDEPAPHDTPDHPTTGPTTLDGTPR